MAESTQRYTTCDVCQVVKKEANHWFRVWMVTDDLIAHLPNVRAMGGTMAPLVAIATWECEPGMAHFHCCGEEHALRKAGELLGKIGGSNARTDG